MKSTVLSVTLLLVALCYSAVAHCSNKCSGHGECVGSDELRCECWSGWSGGDCSERRCPTGLAWADMATAVDTAHALAECSNMGICDTSTGQCTCRDGYTGKSCERMECPDDCSGHGRCRDMAWHATQKDPNPLTYYNVWDSEKIFGCECDPHYHGFKCHLRHCPMGDDPMTTGQVNEVQLLQCVGTSGIFRLTFMGQTTKDIPFDANMAVLKAELEALWTIDTVTVTYVEEDAEICTSAGQIAQIEFTQNFGNLQAITVAEVDGPTSVAIADDGSGITSFDAVEAVGGTKEMAYCSGRGVCDTTSAVCTCSENFQTSDGANAAGTRGDCGFKAAAVVGCPGVISCSGHGVCSNHPEYVCSCSSGWTSADCSERLCPEGRAWFDEPEENDDAHHMVECSNMGNCNRAEGECVCHSGFEGAACERMACPRVAGVTCSGHGTCLSQAQLAAAKLDNGVATSYTYGADPNDPLRWDYSSIYGCECDTGYEGYDCSLRSCPRGDDPKTVGVQEVQIVNCETASDGSFTLKFREEISGVINHDDNEAAVKAALEAMPFQITEVTVTFDSGSTACSNSGGTDIHVTFTQEFGDLPQMTVVDETTVSVSVSTDTDGTKENNICSDRGTCNYSTGICECYTGYASSDGYNGEGDRGDCGYVIPAFSVEAAERYNSENEW